MKVKQTEQGFDVELTVQVTTETYPDSNFNGKAISLVVSAKRQLLNSTEKGIQITKSHVTQV